MKNYDAIIIGAGNAGLSSALTLARSNKKVCIFEKHNIPGGCGTSFRRGRFEFEVALHQLSQMGTDENPGPLRTLFKEYEILDKIKWIPIDSLFTINLPDGRRISIPADRREAEKTLINEFPEEKQGILKYFEICFNFYKEAQDFASKSAESTGEPSGLKKAIVKFGFPKMYPTLAEYGARSTDDVLSEIFIGKEIQLCVSAYWCFMGVPPEKFPFSILAQCTAIYITDKPFYLRGGSQVISQALLEEISKHDGDVKLNCGIKKIIIENDKAVGVIDEFDNEYRANVIISNISPNITYNNLVDKKYVPEKAIDYFKNYEIGNSAFSLFIGLDCAPEELGFKDSFNLTYSSLDTNNDYKNSYNLDTSIDPMVSTCYTIDDKEGYPKGTSVISAITLKFSEPWEKLSPEQYYETKYRLANTMIDRLEKFYPNLREHIEELEVATPLTHMRYLHHPHGAIYGFEQNLKSSVFFFPQEMFIDNLYFASGWVSTCGFGPNYLYGNKVANKILKEMK